MALKSIDSSLFFSKKDPRDPRLGDWGQSWTDSVDSLAKLNGNNFAVFGCPDDEGIALNGGRIGASLAPAQIRRFFYKMTPDVLSREQVKIFDLGDVQNTVSLSERHEQTLRISQALSSIKIPWILLGGGHDYGYACTAGFVRACLEKLKTEKPVVINFDAHLDVRPTDKGYNSGTPFYRLLEEFGRQIHFMELGLQPQCNSVSHWDWAENHGATLIPLKDCDSQTSLKLRLGEFLSDKKKSPVFISLDIDCITSNEAPGCSQSWTTGLKTDHLLAALTWIYENYYVAGLGIFEVSPSLDQDDRTSKLAALFMHHFIFSKHFKASP